MQNLLAAHVIEIVLMQMMVTDISSMHVPKTQNRVIKCKHCIKSKAGDPDVPGAEPGLMSHL